MSIEPHLLYSQLPAIDRLLREPAIESLVVQYGQTLVGKLLRQLQVQARGAIKRYQRLPGWCGDWPQALKNLLARQQRSALQPVFNLSGTVLHTNLGRALLAKPAMVAATSAMGSAVTLGYDLDGAGRGHRDQAIAPGKQVVVSRGELVEIGGAFRIPDVMRQAGCQLVEVGTTNRTHLKDYRNAIGEQTALLMKVHTSNYSIQGFTAAVNEAELALLGAERGIPTATDLGSGSLIDMAQYGLPAEPMPQRLLAAAADLVTFSGDKLLGGPQAGIIVGKKALIAHLQQHPLKRALRVGKITLAALEATLRLYQQPELLAEQLPTLRLLTRPQWAIQQAAERLLPALAPQFSEDFQLRAEPCWSQIGSGSLPIDRLPSYALTFTPIDGRGAALEALAERWRGLPQPVIGRISGGRLWLDLRCLEQESALI